MKIYIGIKNDTPYVEQSVLDFKEETEVIKMRVQIEEKIYGSNFWETCLYRSVLENEELLCWLCE